MPSPFWGLNFRIKEINIPDKQDISRCHSRYIIYREEVQCVSEKEGVLMKKNIIPIAIEPIKEVAEELVKYLNNQYKDW